MEISPNKMCIWTTLNGFSSLYLYINTHVLTKRRRHEFERESGRGRRNLEEERGVEIT